jgi:hypothetical protein
MKTSSRRKWTWTTRSKPPQINSLPFTPDTIYRFYRSIEDAYSYANRTLLKLLLEDQQLVPRLRSLKHYFFLSQSSFLTHFLDLAHSELRKPAKSASIVKLQSFLDLALNSGSFDPLAHYREDVKVTMATSGLYDWLLKVVSVSGAIGGEGEELAGAAAGVDAVDEGGKDKEKEKKQLQGMLLPTLFLLYVTDDRNPRHRRFGTGLHRQVPSLARHLPQDDPSVPTPLPVPPPP